MHAKAPWADLVALGAAVDATDHSSRSKPKAVASVLTDPSPTAKRRRSRGPHWSFRLLGLCCFTLLVMTYQNCSVDMSRQTPGASVSGFCPTLSASDRTTLASALTAMKQKCAGCHSSDNAGGALAGFKVPSSLEDVNSATIQNDAHLNMCARGYSKVISTIDGKSAKQHAGGTFPKSEPSNLPMYNWLETQL